MISMLQRIKERHQLLMYQQQQEQDEQRKRAAPDRTKADDTIPCVPLLVQAEEATDKTASDPAKSTHHMRRDRKSREKSRKIPKEIFLHDPIEAISPLRLSKTLFKQRRKSQPDEPGEQQHSEESSQDNHRKSPEKKKQRKRREEPTEKIRSDKGPEVPDTTVNHKNYCDDGGSMCSSSLQPNDSSMNESWDMTSFLSGEASFTQQITTTRPYYDGNQSHSSKCHVVATSRRGSVASSRCGSVASSRRDSICSSMCPSEGSTTSTLLDELEVRSKGTIRFRPSYSEIKGHVVSELDSTKAAILRRYSIDNSSLRSAPAKEVDLPTCLRIGDTKLNGPNKRKDPSIGACYGIIDKYMLRRIGDSDETESQMIRRSQSLSVDSQSISEEERSLSTTSSALSSESSKRLSMTCNGLKAQLKESYPKRIDVQTLPGSTDPPGQEHFEMPLRSKSDTTTGSSIARSDKQPSCKSPARTNSCGSTPTTLLKGSLPILSPGLSSPRKPLSNADIFKKSSGRNNKSSSNHHSKPTTMDRPKSSKTTHRPSPSRSRTRSNQDRKDNSLNQPHKSPGVSGKHHHRSKQYEPSHTTTLPATISSTPFVQTTTITTDVMVDSDANKKPKQDNENYTDDIEEEYDDENDFVEYNMPPSLAVRSSAAAVSRRQSTGYVVATTHPQQQSSSSCLGPTTTTTIVSSTEDSTIPRRSATETVAASHEAIYPDKDETDTTLRNYLESELNVAKPSKNKTENEGGRRDNSNNDETPRSSDGEHRGSGRKLNGTKVEEHRLKKQNKSRISKAA